MPKLLSIFNDYLQKGGEAEGVAQLCHSLQRIVEVRECRFSSADWTASGAPNRLQQAYYMIRNPRSLALLREMQTSFRSDAWLVHNVFPVGSAAIYREATRQGIPIIQYLHNFRPFSVNGYLWAGGKLAPAGLRKDFSAEIWNGAWQESRIKTAWFAFVLKMMHARNWFQSVKAWVAISDFVRERMIEAGLAENKVFTLPYPWKMQNHDYQPNEHEKHYLFLGRMIEAKGVLILLRAWEILEQRLGERTPRLLIAGAGPLESKVRAEAEKLKAVEFVGHVVGEAKKHALTDARAIIAPSLWWEAMGLIAYESYDYGKPILAARSGGLQECVIHERTGLLHQAGNARELADQVEWMESNKQVRQAMGREGREWLTERTNEVEWLKKFGEILRFCLSGS